MYNILRNRRMEPLLTQLLNLPGIVVESLRETETDLMLEVEAWTDKATCPRCSSSSSNLHQNHVYWVETCLSVTVKLD